MGVNSLSKGRVTAGAFVGAVTADAGSIGTTELADGAVTSAKIASLAVGTTDIAAGAVTAAKIASLTVGTTSLAATAVTTAKITDAAVTAPKISFGWSTLTGTVAGAGTLPAASGGYLVVNPGTSKGLVFTSSGTAFSVPTPGDWYKFSIDATPGSTRVINIKSTAATFNGSDKVAVLNAVDQFLVIEAASSTRWVIVSAHASVTFAGTT